MYKIQQRYHQLIVFVLFGDLPTRARVRMLRGKLSMLCLSVQPVCLMDEWAGNETHILPPTWPYPTGKGLKTGKSLDSVVACCWRSKVVSFIG